MNQLLPIPSELNPSSIKDDLNARMRADDLYGISAPALVRHQAFWIRRQGDNSDQLYVNAYEALIKCLTERHYAPNPSEPITSSLCDEVVRYGIPLSVAFRYQAKFDASMRLELRGEYLSVTTIVELSEHELADQLRHSLPAESRDIKCKIAKFWEAFEKEALSEFPFTTTSQNVFADLRGVVLSDSETSAQQIKERLLSLLHEAAADRFEPAVNLLLGGSALYMGGLRLHTPLAAETKPPLEFIICNIDPPNVSSLQLGRIVYLVTLICTQRICALSDALSLHQVGRELSGLETARLLGGDPLTIIQKAHHDYTDTEKNFSKKTGSGPQYRIEQSRSYVAQLRANLKLLEIERLASDQPIGDLINQRSGSDFDFIDRLGKRLERATSKIASLDQTYLALNNIQLAANSNGIYDEIRKIQRIGDLALFLALLPYYLTHMLELFFPGGVISIVAVLFWTGVGSFGIFRLVCARLNLIIHGYVPFTRRWNFQHRGPRIALSTFATALALVAMTPKLLRSSEAWLPWSYAPRLDDRMGQSRPLDGTACGFVTAYGNADIRGTSALAHGRRTHGQHN